MNWESLQAPMNPLLMRSLARRSIQCTLLEVRSPSPFPPFYFNKKCWEMMKYSKNSFWDTFHSDLFKEGSGTAHLESQKTYQFFNFRSTLGPSLEEYSNCYYTSIKHIFLNTILLAWIQILSGDMKNTLMTYGLAAATANFPCNFCVMPKKDFAGGKKSSWAASP